MLTGEMIYEAWRRQEQVFALPDWDDPINTLVRIRFEGLAQELNAQLDTHRTQPLTNEQEAAAQQTMEDAE